MPSKRTRSSPRPDTLNDTLVAEVCKRFLDGSKMEDIAGWLIAITGKYWSRESVYPVIRYATKKGILKLHPTPEKILSRRIAERYRGGQDADRIHVVSVRAESAKDLLPVRAAELIVERMREVAIHRDRVGIGVGGGGTMNRVSRALADELLAEEALPPLGFHVLSSGFSVDRPRTAPITFLSYFDQLPKSTEFIGLFAPAVVEASEYTKVQSLPGVKESFARAKYVDIVVTSLASAEDEHGEMNRFMAMSGEDTQKDIEALRRNGWVGDLQYQLYSADGPLTDIGLKVRALSLFDLADLKKLAARRKKHVIVVAGPCGICKRSKVQALLPLLEGKNDRMKVWSDIVLDATTAEELLRV